MPKMKKNDQEISTLSKPIALHEATPQDNLREKLEQIKNYEGVIGYIQRNTTSASIDLKDPTRIIDYAILSSSAKEAGQELSELFDLGNVQSIIIEGKTTKTLLLTLDENNISIFMEKNADSEKILKKLHSF